MPEEVNNVTELAVKRAAAGKLYGERIVVSQFQKVEARNWRCGQRGPGLAGIHRPQSTGGEVGEELGKGLLGFTQNRVVHAFNRLVTARDVGPPRHDPRTGPSAPFNHLAHRISLDNHRGDEDQLRRLDQSGRQLLNVEIHDAALVIVRHHGSHGGQAERRHERPLPNEGEGVLVTPVGIRNLGIDEQKERF